MKAVYIFYSSLLICLSAGGQNVSPSVMANGGGLLGSSVMTLSWTLGETVIETQANSSVLLTQGFQQADLIRSLSGKLTYLGDQDFPLDGCTVFLKTNTGVNSQTLTDAAGNYFFPLINNGNYHLDASTDKPWGGVNAIDALKTMKHFAGISSLTGLALQAANVDTNTTVNAIDALLIMKRFVNLTDSFASGDWLFENHTVTINGFNALADNFKGICFGDVDGSYNPPGFKNEPTITVNIKGALLIKEGEVIEVPVYISQNLEPASFSCILKYPKELIEILGVILYHDNGNVVYNLVKDELHLAWYTLNPICITAGEQLFVLKIKLKEGYSTQFSDPEFSFNPESVISDLNGTIVNGISLTIPLLIPYASGFKLDQNQPNPFTRQTLIHFTLPEPGYLRLFILDVLGNTIKPVFEGTQLAGSGDLVVKDSELTAGVYFYRMIYQTEYQQFIQTRKMIVTK